MTGERRIILESIANVPSDAELLLDAINDGIYKFLPKVLENLFEILINHSYAMHGQKPQSIFKKEKQSDDFGGLLNRNKNRIYHNIYKEKDGI